MMYQLPSSNETMISVPAELRKSLSCLDIVWSDMVESEDSKVRRKYETDFLKGAPPQWLNFNTSANSPLVERDRFKDLEQLVEEKRRKSCLITEVSLQYQPGSGGSTLAMQVLWHFRKDLRCARVIDSDLDIKELSKKVVDLFLLSNKEGDQKTVLLLLDIQENTNDDLLNKSILRQNLKIEIHERNITTNTPVVIIFNCSPADLLTIGHSTDDVKLTMKLSTNEKLRFAQKKKQLTTKYKKMSQTFHAFNIMQGGFQKKGAEDLITKEMIEYVENHKESSSTRLLSFLALINSYVPGSHLSKLFCEEFMDQTEQTTDHENHTLETRMKPFMDLIVIFSEGQCIRLAHPMIADACLKMFTEHNVARSDIALDFLKKLVKGNEHNYEQICERILITRLETGKNKQQFSRLILDIIEENKTNDCIRLLKLASDLFSEDPFYPQTLARLYYIKVKENNKYEEARKWAEEANKRAPNKSDIKDTLGQVYKKHLQTFSDIKACFDIAKCAIQAFKDEVKVAEEQAKENTKFNYRGYYGFLQVCSVIHEISPKNPPEHSELECSEFISGLKSDVEMKYDFFEWFLTFSRPNICKEDPEYIHKDVEKCYIHYFKVGKQTDEATLNDKKMKSFGGLLNILKLDIGVLKENWSAIENPQPDNEAQIVLYILANVILSQSGESCANAENLQSRLQTLWVSKEQDRSPEFYLLILLLFWPDDAQPAIANNPNLENCVEYLSQSYERNYQKYLRGRYLVPLFFFGKGEGLQRLIHASKLDQIDRECLTEGHKKAEVECLQRINGKVKNNEVFAVVQGQEIQVTPHNWVSVCKSGQVSFYLGFNIRGPVAYNIRYEESEVTSELHG